MASVDVIKSCLDSIRHISDHIEGAILYLDAGCTEAFQFLGAYPLLLELGVCAVCSLENIFPLDTVVDGKSNFSDAKKVVVITSRLLSDSHRYILRCLSTHKTVRCCAVFTSISEIAHSAYIDSPLGPDAFSEYESLLIQDYEEIVKKYKNERSSLSEESGLNTRLSMENEGWPQRTLGTEDSPRSEASPSGRYSLEANSMTPKEGSWPSLAVSVHHFPMVLCPLSPKVFVLPSEGTVSESCLSNNHEDSLSPGLPPISSGSHLDGEDTPPGAIFTAHHLYHLAAKMDLKLEIYSLGDLSKTIGKMMMDMSSLYDVGRRKRSAGLLLIDRTLDLITTCCHGDSLVDRIFSSLPRRDRNTSSQVIPNKRGPASVQRAPLDVQIPLKKYLLKEERAEDETSLVDAFEAFLHGWNSIDCSSKVSDLTNLSRIIHDKDYIQSDCGMLSGSLVSSDHYQGAQFSEALLYRRTKDGTLLFKRWLEEILRREKVPVPVKSRQRFAATAELHSMISALTKDQSSFMRYKGIIQQTVASAIALSEPHSSRWDAFVGAEKMLRISATSEMSQNLSAQIRDLVNRSVLIKSHGQKNFNGESSRGLLTFRDALLLGITGYMLAGENFPTSGSGGPFSWEEEHFLKEAIVDAILEDPGAACLKFLHGMDKELEANLNKKKAHSKEDSSNELAVDDFDDDQWGNWGDEDSEQSSEHVYDDMQLKLELHDRVDSLFKFFHKLCGLKGQHVASREGPLALETGISGNPCEGPGLLHKLLTMVLSKYDIPGLEYHSSTVGRLFKSGFGRFGLGQAKPNLGDQNIILVFIVGGINGHEVVEAQEALSESGRDDVELIIGGTTLLTPEDMLELLLGSSSYF